jgi:putative flavoprotein involved in K+ transport
MSEQIEAIVIGAGHAGLATSYYLTRAGLPHLILERGRVAERWHSSRWDSFTLVTPNWMCRLPGYPYAGEDPDGFLAQAEVVAYLQGYAASFAAPVREGVRVTAVETSPSGSPRGRGYRVVTDGVVYQTPVVVVATGFFEHPKIPAAAARLAPGVRQIHSSEYLNPAALPPGAVLVVGSGQSGCQIAQELHESGRQVYLSTGSAGRVPRRYRGQDATWWMARLGRFEQTVDTLTSPRAKLAGNPHLSGRSGGQTINLHRFARDGIVLLGHLRSVSRQHVTFAPDLEQNLAKADQLAADFQRDVDAYLEQQGIEVPGPDAGTTDEYDGDDGYRQDEIRELDLRAAGIRTIVWAAGFNVDYSFVRIPVFDQDGYPIQRRGVTAYPGLYFMGVHYQHKNKSDLFYGVGEDAAYVAAAAIASVDSRSVGVGSSPRSLWQQNATRDQRPGSVAKVFTRGDIGKCAV